MARFTTIYGCPIKCMDCEDAEDCYDLMDCDYISRAIKKLSYYENLERQGVLPDPEKCIGQKCYKIVGDGAGRPRIEEDIVRNFQVRINDHYTTGCSAFLSRDEAGKAFEAISKRITLVDAIKDAKIQMENEAMKSKNNLARAYAFQAAIDILDDEMKKVGFMHENND